MKIQACSGCGIRVVPRTDGSCPSCGAEIAEPREVEAVSVPAKPPEPIQEVKATPSKPAPDEEKLPVTEEDEIADFLAEAAQAEEPATGIRITADPHTYTKHTIKRTMEALRWAAFAGWIAIPLGGKLGRPLAAAVILLLDATLLTTLARTQAYSQEEVSKLKRKVIFWGWVGTLPFLVWYSGYFFWEEGFNRFFPWYRG